MQPKYIDNIIFKKYIKNAIPNNNINQVNQELLNTFNNPFIINSLTQSLMYNINTAGPFQIDNLNRQEWSLQSNKTNLNSKELIKYKRATIDSDEDNMNVNEEEDELEDNKSRNRVNKPIKN